MILGSRLQFFVGSTAAVSSESMIHAPRGDSCPEITPDGAWNWCTDPRAVYYEGQSKKTYVGWVNCRGDVEVGSYDHDTRKIKVHVIKERLHVDDHANPALLKLPDGHLMIFYCAHNGQFMAYRRTLKPEDISSWSEERRFEMNTEGLKGYTYPHPVLLPAEDDTIYLFWRGNNWMPNFSTTRDGVNWTEAKTLIRGTGRRPYVKFCSDGSRKIHFAFTDGHPLEEPENNIYYACYSGGAIHRADGSLIKKMAALPLSTSEADLVYDTAFRKARSWIWDIAVDSAGKPTVVYATFPKRNDHRYRYAKWDGQKWDDSEITRAGRWMPETRWFRQEQEPFYSGGIALDHNNPSIVYLSRQVWGRFEIEKWMTQDEGKTWTSKKITAHSRKDNVRPMVPYHRTNEGLEVIWMHGHYEGYTCFSTALRFCES